MARINITIDQDEILALLVNNSQEAFKSLLANCLNGILKAESAEQLKAQPYERSEVRTDCRNGVRERSLRTRIGTITLQVPRHRNLPFKSMVFENYSRSEAALISCMAEMVVCGVSTRKVARVMEELCGTSYSKSAVSELCRVLDKDVEAFRFRPLTGKYPFVVLDATYFKVRENHRIVSKALLVACGTNESGIREIIGFGVFPAEGRPSWTEFLEGLKKRGLSGVLMIVSDANQGMVSAIGTVFPKVPWQRCQFHFSRNIADKAPQKYQAGLHAELQEMFNKDSIEEARQKRDAILADYRDIAEKAMECLENGFEDSMTVMQLPKGIRRYYRTSNHIERINRELKRRSNVIGVFPNEASLIRQIGSVLMEQNDLALNKRKIFSRETYLRLISGVVPAALVAIAAEQQRLLAA